MLRLPAALIVAALALGPATASASDCTARSLAGNWVVGTDGTLCLVQIARTGAFAGVCKQEDAAPFNVRGRASVNAACELRVFSNGVQIGEGRAWATAAASRLDAVAGVIRLDDDDDFELMTGYRRPASGLPLD